MEKRIMKWYKIRKVGHWMYMHVEENYPNSHKSWIKGKQWLKQWLVKKGSKQSNKWNKGWKKNSRKLKFKGKKKGWNKAQKKRS
jgi:hypothetical protein